MISERLALEGQDAYRRRRFVTSHRRRSLFLQLIKPLLLAVAVVSIPLSVASWIAGSSQFRLREIAVGGTDKVAREQVEAMLAPLLGTHILRLSLADVEAKLRANRWIEGATIRKELPDSLVVDIRERYPVALYRSNDGLMYIDREGFLIDSYDPTGQVDLLLLSSSDNAPVDVAGALKVADALERIAPAWSAGLSEIEILGEGGFRLYSGNLPFPVLLSSTTAEIQLRRLQWMFPEIARRYPAVELVDLRFAEQLVIQPAARPRSQEG